AMGSILPADSKINPHAANDVLDLLGSLDSPSNSTPNSAPKPETAASMPNPLDSVFNIPSQPVNGTDLLSNNLFDVPPAASAPVVGNSDRKIPSIVAFEKN